MWTSAGHSVIQPLSELSKQLLKLLLLAGWQAMEPHFKKPLLYLGIVQPLVPPQLAPEFLVLNYQAINLIL
jgi:hypothetical protein